MCLIIKRSKFSRFLQDKLSILCNPRPKRAKKDIIVYKVLCTDTLFPHSIKYPFVWDFDYVYSTNLRACISIYVYSTGLSTKFDSTDYFIVNEGFHAFINKDSASKLTGKHYWKVYKAVIPRGSKYYIGTHGDIVSNQLKIIERID